MPSLCATATKHIHMQKPEGQVFYFAFANAGALRLFQAAY